MHKHIYYTKVIFSITCAQRYIRTYTHPYMIAFILDNYVCIYY